MDALGPFFEGCLDLLARACGVMSARVRRAQSIALLAVGIVLAGVAIFALGRVGTAALLIPFGGTLIAGLVGSVPQPYPLTAALASTAFALMAAIPFVFLGAF